MKKSRTIAIFLSIILVSLFTSCNENKSKEKEIVEKRTDFTMMENSKMGNDKRTSLKLNSMQKN
ncbi:hypothetical protein MNBD_BACTEROID04-765, partial [hydrothermal vent metagenome]